MKSEVISTGARTIEHVPVPVKRLLLVEDDASTREALNKVLQHWSFATYTAATFREARLVMLTEIPITIIVCDYRLPDGNGLQFLDWLKRRMLVQVPFLLISGEDPPVPSTSEEYEFLAKPFRLEELHDRLEKLSGVKPQTAAAFNWTTAQEAMASVYARSKPAKKI